MNQTAEQKTQSDLKPLYTRSVVNALGTGMVSPFMGAYAVKLGAASSEMGWFQSSSNLSNNVTQIFWGRLSDKLQRRVPFIIIGSLIIAALWLPMIFVTDATQLIVLLAIQALLGSMAVPAWTALIGDMVPSRELGRANASVYLWTSVGSLIATLASGIIMLIIGGSLHEMFLVPLLVATVCGAASSLIMIGVKEREYKNENHASTKRFTWELIGIDVLARARKTPEFVRFLYAESLFQFFMSISWPLFSITQIRILNASMLQIALLTIVQTFFTIIFQGWAGRLADTRGRKPLLFFFEPASSLCP